MGIKANVVSVINFIAKTMKWKAWALVVTEVDGAGKIAVSAITDEGPRLPQMIAGPEGVRTIILTISDVSDAQVVDVMAAIASSRG